MLVAPLMPFYATRMNAPEWMVGWADLGVRGRAAHLVADLGQVFGSLWQATGDAHRTVGIGPRLSRLRFCDQSLDAVRLSSGPGTRRPVRPGWRRHTLPDTMAPAERAKALGWISAATSAGVLIGPVIGSVARSFGTEVPGMVAAGLMLLCVVFAWRWLPESRVHHTIRRAANSCRPTGRSRKPLADRRASVGARASRDLDFTSSACLR